MGYMSRLAILTFLSWFVFWAFPIPEPANSAAPLWVTIDLLVCLALAFVWHKWSLGRRARAQP